jgi:HAD superfamily hydrolase (TIGR01549 family)
MVQDSRGKEGAFPTIFFDLGNTLLYYQGDRVAIELEAYEIVARTLHANGFDVPVKKILKRFQKEMQKYYQRRNLTWVEETTVQQLRKVLEEFGYTNIPQLQLRKTLDKMYHITEPYWQLDPDTHECLQRLKSAGCRLGLISNASDAPNAFRLIKTHNLDAYFSVKLISSIVGYRKPHEEIFTIALRACADKAKEDIYMVGDLLATDVIGGNQTGIMTIWLSKYAEMTEEKDIDPVARPDFIISDLKQLSDWFAEKYGF